jgi:hypothetical protein
MNRRDMEIMLKRHEARLIKIEAYLKLLVLIGMGSIASGTSGMVGSVIAELIK